VEFLGLPIRYVTYEQGGMVVNGLRIGPFAYVTDIKDWSEEILPDLMGVEQLILGAVHWAPSNFHLNIEEAIAFARRIEAKRVWLTHLSHGVNSMDEERLPEGVFFAYDGMELNFALDDGQSENS
jgi:phosphoribosyl 1,2-cyclic phosphate phosphodiesterase